MKIQHSVICWSLYAALVVFVEHDVLAVCQQVDYSTHWTVKSVSQKFLLLLKKMFLLYLVLMLLLTEWKQNFHLQHSHTIDHSDQHEWEIVCFLQLIHLLINIEHCQKVYKWAVKWLVISCLKDEWIKQSEHFQNLCLAVTLLFICI